jgi:hypothetical protein
MIKFLIILLLPLSAYADRGLADIFLDVFKENEVLQSSDINLVFSNSRRPNYSTEEGSLHIYNLMIDGEAAGLTILQYDTDEDVFRIVDE